MNTDWTLARRAEKLNPSSIREILKLTEQPGIVSLAGGLPSPDSFPVVAIRDASARVLRDVPHQALQYAASEGHGPLREWIAAHVAERGLRVDASQVLVTSGSQQGLDLLAKVLVDPGSRIAVEAPTYLGALQAFAPFEPEFATIDGDDEGPLPDALEAGGRGARFAYLVPNFQNPTGRCLPASRRAALVERAQRIGLPIVEDDPYGELWYDAAPPPPLAASAGDGSVYLGSFSKVLAPGLRIGYLIAPQALFSKLLQARQAADLHTSGFAQRIVHEVVKDGLLKHHLPTVRTRYRAQRDAMRTALERHLPAGCRFATPAGGMFFWIELPPSIDAGAMLPRAVAAGVAYVPGAGFFATAARANTLRLSFVTVAPDVIDRAVATLAKVIAAESLHLVR